MQEYKVTVGEYSPGTIRYYKPGTEELHRIDGPAVEFASGTKNWFQNGMRHRVDGPAVVTAHGDKCWWQNDKRHRIDGPAIESASGTKCWYQDGKRHRIDGPAVEYANGDVEYYIHGEWLTLAQFKKKTAPVKEMTVAEIEAILGHSVKVVRLGTSMMFTILKKNSKRKLLR